MTASILENLFGRTILITTRTSTTREFLHQCLQSFRCNIMAVSDRAETLAQLKQNPQIDVAIYEVDDSIEDGVTLLRATSDEIMERMPFFLITGRKDESLSQAYYHGADGVFILPTHFDEFIKGVAYSYGVVLSARERLYQRQRLRKTAALFSPTSSEKKNSGHVSNISRGGMFISSPDVLPAANQIVNFRIAADTSDQAVEGRGVVRWLRPFREFGRPSGFGIEFLDLDDDAARKLHALSGR